MRVLGIDIHKADILWLIVDGTRATGNFENVTRNRLDFPSAGQSEADNLVALRQLLEAAIPPLRVDRIGIVRATQSTSAIRAKVECIAQLAAHACGIPCDLVAPQTISSAGKRKIPLATGSTIEEAFGPIEPRYLRDAAICGWCVINASSS